MISQKTWDVSGVLERSLKILRVLPNLSGAGFCIRYRKNIPGEDSNQGTLERSDIGSAWKLCSIQPTTGPSGFAATRGLMDGQYPHACRLRARISKPR
jgi:hypothetical protein